jgi:hypothetical protein
MDLLDKAQKITMISLSILYNTNPMPLAICALTLPTDLEQQWSCTKKELQEAYTFVPIRTKKNRRKATCRVIIKKVNVRTCNNNSSFPKSFQFCVVGKRKMIDNEIPSNNILARL